MEFENNFQTSGVSSLKVTLFSFPHTLLKLTLKTPPEFHNTLPIFTYKTTLCSFSNGHSNSPNISCINTFPKHHAKALNSISFLPCKQPCHHHRKKEKRETTESRRRPRRKGLQSSLFLVSACLLSSFTYNCCIDVVITEFNEIGLWLNLGKGAICLFCYEFA